MGNDSLKKPAVFFDKDGTLVVNVPYNVDPNKIQLFPDSVSSVRRLKELGYLIIVVSNQSGVARGYFEEGKLEAVSIRLNELFEQENLQIDGIYYCPHHPHSDHPQYGVICECRKPLPGMLLEAAAKFNIDLATSWLVGDIPSDIEAGKRAGCHTILLSHGGEKTIESPIRTPDFTVNSLSEAVDKIASNSIIK